MRSRGSSTHRSRRRRPRLAVGPRPRCDRFDGQTDLNFGGGRGLPVTGCGTGDYTYFRDHHHRAAWRDAEHFTVDFVNIDDAAQISIFNSANPGGTPG